MTHSKFKRLTIDEAIQLLSVGKIVALPTETVYGLAGRVDRIDTIKNIFEAKGRPQNNPVICHISSISMLEKYAFIDKDDQRLFQFWPGPLTILLKRRSTIPDIITAGSEYCGFRMPNHSLFLEAIEKVGVPLAAPSANQSGETSPVNPSMVESSLSNRISGVVDGGQCSVGIESTVVLRNKNEIKILRPGAITKYDFERIGFSVVDKFSNQENSDIKSIEKSRSTNRSAGLLSPGQLPVHYAPKSTLLLIEHIFNFDFWQKLNHCFQTSSVIDCLDKYLKTNIRLNTKILANKTACFIILPNTNDEKLQLLENKQNSTLIIHIPAEPNQLTDFASSLYTSFDQLSSNDRFLVSFQVENRGIGIAINDRLKRAASYRLS